MIGGRGNGGAKPSFISGRAAGVCVWLLCLGGLALAVVPPIEAAGSLSRAEAETTLPKLRTPAGSTAPLLPLRAGYPPLTSALVRHGPPLPPPRPLPATWHSHAPAVQELPMEAAALRSDLVEEVSGVMLPSRRAAALVAQRALAMMTAADQSITSPQMVVVVDRNPAVERLYMMFARPGGADGWSALGSVRVSTGQADRKDYYITPVGVFAHTDAILDFRAQGTYNEHHVRGLGLAGMRVWDFGWQWALKGWHTDGEGGDIRLQMHATDPTLLERRLGRPASEGCVRVSSSMNRFMDRHGVLDADYERTAIQDVRYRALLAPDRTPTPIAGRFLVVTDSSLPLDTPPTAASRPPDWPSPPPSQPADAPGTDTSADAPVH